MHRDTKTLLFHILGWGLAAAACWALYARFPAVYDSLFHHAPEPGAAAPTAEEIKLHEVHVGLWRTVTLYLAIFASTGTFLAAVISLFNVFRYEGERGADPAADHH